MKIWKMIWECWKRLAHWIGVINTHILLFLFYFLIFAPFAFFLKLFQPNLLDHRVGRQKVTSSWRQHAPVSSEMEHFKNQF